MQTKDQLPLSVFPIHELLPYVVKYDFLKFRLVFSQLSSRLILPFPLSLHSPVCKKVTLWAKSIPLPNKLCKCYIRSSPTFVDLLKPFNIQVQFWGVTKGCVTLSI